MNEGSFDSGGDPEEDVLVVESAGEFEDVVGDLRTSKGEVVLDEVGSGVEEVGDDGSSWRGPCSGEEEEGNGCESSHRHESHRWSPRRLGCNGVSLVAGKEEDSAALRKSHEIGSKSMAGELFD